VCFPEEGELVQRNYELVRKKGIHRAWSIDIDKSELMKNLKLLCDSA
jgi:hypothetical protein